MSLLNDMLRDLSQHKPVVDGAEGYDESLLQSSSIARRKEQSWKQLVILFVVIFAVVLGTNYFIHKFFGKNAVQHSLNIVDQKRVTEPMVPPTVNATPAVEKSMETKAAENKKEASAVAFEDSASIEMQNHIDDLLQQAERAMGMDRLTSPVEDNAYSYYQKILGMSADNNDAKEGLDRIASRYLMKAQEQMQLGNLSQADALIQRARFVSARYVQAHEISSELAAQHVDANNSFVEANVSAVAGMPTSSAQPINSQQQVAQIPETVKPFAVAEATMVSISPNAEWKDEQLARHAQELIAQGKQAEALALLKAFVAKEQKPALSAAVLADLYIQQGNYQAAEIILQKADYLTADAKAKIQAQILSANGDDLQAITVLEQHLTLAEANESYRSLLASLYHKTARYSQSIISYQRLMNSFGEKPAYWLGLALAYDGLAQHKSALQAYQRLRAYPQLQEQVKKYTDQRIAALRSE